MTLHITHRRRIESYDLPLYKQQANINLICQTIFYLSIFLLLETFASYTIGDWLIGWAFIMHPVAALLTIGVIIMAFEARATYHVRKMVKLLLFLTIGFILRLALYVCCISNLSLSSLVTLQLPK